MKNFSIIILGIIGVISCTNEKKNVYDYNEIESLVVDSLDIEIPDDVSPMQVYWDYNQVQDNDLLINSNYPLTEIYPYDVKTKEWLATQRFEKEGPDGIGIGTGFYFHNKDSLFIMNSYQFRMFLFNESQQKVATFQVPDDYNINLFTNRKVTYYKGALYIPGTDYLMNNKFFTRKANLLVKFDFESQAFKKIVKFPKGYQNRRWKKELLNMSFKVIDDEIISSFGKSHNIYVHDLEGNLKKELFAKSKFINNIPPLGGLDNNSPKAVRNLYLNGFYTYVLYDKHREKYYRLAFHLPNKYRSNKSVSLGDMSISVVVLNKDLSYNGEMKLSEKVSGYFCFINEKGLNLSIKSKYKYSEKEILKFYTFLPKK